jgi:hypothetical protein
MGRGILDGGVLCRDGRGRSYMGSSGEYVRRQGRPTEGLRQLDLFKNS